MSIFGSPIENSIIQTASVQETASRARDRERVTSERTNRYTDSLDLRITGTESPDAVRNIPGNESEQADQERKGRKRQPKSGEDRPHIDVTAQANEAPLRGEVGVGQGQPRSQLCALFSQFQLFFLALSLPSRRQLSGVREKRQEPNGFARIGHLPHDTQEAGREVEEEQEEEKIHHGVHGGHGADTEGSLGLWSECDWNNRSEHAANDSFA